MSDTRSDVDVPESTLLPETQGDVAPAPRSPRDELMAKIAERRVAQIEREVGQWDSQPQDDGARENHAATRTVNPSLGEVEEDRVYSGPYADPEVEGSAGSAAPVEQSERAPPVAPSPRAEPPTAASVAQTTTFPIELDGQIIHVTQEQMAHLARMGAIANQALYQYNQQPREQTPAQRREVEQPRPATVDDGRINETVRAIQYGDPETAATALKGLITDVTAGVPHVDPAQIRQQAAEDAWQRVQAQNTHNQILSLIQTEQADILANPGMRKLAAIELQELRQANIAIGNQFTEFDLVREAGTRVRNAFGVQSQPTGQAPAQAGIPAPQAPNLIVRRSVADIEGRKRAAPQRTAAVIDRRSAAPEAPRPPSGSDIVEQMRKARFQSSMR